MSGVGWRGESPLRASHVAVWMDTDQGRDSPYSVRRLRLPSPGLRPPRLRTRRYVVHTRYQIKLTSLSFRQHSPFPTYPYTHHSHRHNHSTNSSTNPYSSEIKRSLPSNINSNSPKLKLKSQKIRSNSSNQLLMRARLIGLQERT